MPPSLALVHRIVSSGAIDIAVAVDGAPDRGTALFVHATGFCKETWAPVVGALADVAAISIDQRGHGGSGVPDPPFDWWDLAEDVRAVVADVAPARPLAGVGHSSGGAALAMAEIVAPGTFDTLVLVEPIVYPAPYGRTEDHPLTVSALRRRRVFDSLDHVLESFRGRGPFARWTEEALQAYARFGTVDEGDGRRRLACAPEVEAEFYRGATAHGAWDRLDEIACPVTVIVGEASASHAPPLAQALAARFRTASLMAVPGATHFVPMERPEVVADAVRQALGAVGQ